jgi:DNA-binding CsgD family transcriptional regulator
MSDIAMAEPDTLTEAERRAFEAMTQRAKVGAAEVADASGVDDPVLVLRTLVARGFASYDASEDKYFPAAPFTLLKKLLQEADDRLARTRSALGQVLDMVPPSDVDVAPPNDFTTYHDPRGARERIIRCVERTRRELVFVNNARREREHSREHAAEAALIARGIRVRGLYEQGAVAAPGGLEDLVWSLNHGEEARATLATPSQWLMVDQEIVIAPLHRGKTYSDGLVEVRHPTLAALFAAYFESLWATAVPLTSLRAGRREDTYDADDRALASLLATGMNDKAIARQLEVSERTAHRRVTALMLRLGAESRFQAGVQAALRGLLG